MYGPVSRSTGQSADVIAPGAPGQPLASQIDNKSWAVTATAPVADSDGSPLTGLTKLTFATGAMNADGSDPTAGMSMEQIKALPGAQVADVPATPDLAGQSITAQLPIVALGQVSWFAVAANDA